MTQKTLSSTYVEPAMPRWWSALILWLTIAAIGVTLVDLIVDEGSEAAMIAARLDLGICAIFWADFSVRLGRAEQRWPFVRRNWFDLVGAIPLAAPLRAARVVRFLRLFRATRLAALLLKLMRGHNLGSSAANLRAVGTITTLVWVVAALAFYSFEHGRNDGIQDVEDALWWSLTTLSTVGYGDLVPRTPGGRLIAGVTMITGVGVLGALAANIAAAILDVQDRSRRGSKSHMLKDHLLVLGWNDKSHLAIEAYRHDPRYRQTPVCVVADLERTPVDDGAVRFVRGVPCRRAALESASAQRHSAAIVFATDPNDARSDHQTAVTVHLLRRMNAGARISAELVDATNHELLTDAGCDAVIDTAQIASSLLVRAIQDAGVSELITELLSNGEGSEIYRIAVPDAYVGKTFREYAFALVDRRCCLLGVARGHQTRVNPEPSYRLEQGDEVFVVAEEPVR